VEIGDILGYVTYSYNGNYIGKSLIVAASSLIPQNTIVQITSENQLEYIKTDGIIENRPFSLEFVIALSVSVLLLVAIILINNKTKKHLKIQKEQEDSIKSDSKDNIEE
jgi:low affinity Fe/Cu permease